MNKLKLFSIIAASSTMLLVSCGGGGGTKKGGGTKGKFTSKTGWNPNDKNGWFFSGKPQKQKGWPGMVYVEGGTFTMGLVKDDVMHDWNNTPRRMQVSSFFLGETEITNYEYREYTTWLKFVVPLSDPSVKDINVNNFSLFIVDIDIFRVQRKMKLFNNPNYRLIFFGKR